MDVGLFKLASIRTREPRFTSKPHSINENCVGTGAGHESSTKFRFQEGEKKKKEKKEKRKRNEGRREGRMEGSWRG